jgi:hypothetical protein
MAKNCPACGSEIVYSGRGRPRRYCETCTPPGSSTGVWLYAWLAQHRDELEAERLRRHAERMAESRRRREENQATIAANRRRAEAKRKAAA